MALPSNPRLWHNLLVLLCARSCALCSSKACWKCSGHRSSPTYSRGLSPCSISERSCLPVPEQHGTVSPCCPWHRHCPGTLQGPTIALRLPGAPGFPCPQPTAPTIASVWRDLETAAASSSVPRKAGKGQWLWFLQPRNTRSSRLCQQTCFSLISSSGYDTLPSLGFFCLLKHWAV